MEPFQEMQDNYRKNLWCLQDVTDKLLGHMKGYGFSFRAAITDKNGDFAEEKLQSFVGELLSGWAEELRDGVYPDRPGAEDPAAGYIQARRELYGLYLYLAMRCSLCEGAYALTSERDEEKERADFAFLLGQAKRLARSWCVMAEAGGAKTNEPYEGFDACFGLHLYHVLAEPAGDTLTPYGQTPAQNLAALTNEGSMKRIYCKRLAPPPAVEETPEAPAADAPVEEYYEDEYADFGGDYDPAEDGWDLAEPFEGELPAFELDELSAEYERDDQLAHLNLRFADREEYLAACRRFAALYRQAPAEVLRGFCEELEEMVNLYLLRHGLTVLNDTDKALDVYSRIFDGPCRQAKRYARGLLWETM